MRFCIPILFLIGTAILNAQTYRVGPGDLLKISVVQLEEIDGDYRIDNTGNVNLPYVSKIEVKDLSLAELQERVTESLKTYVRDPQVFIDVLEYNYKPITVIGAVKEPGKIKRMMQNVSLIDAVTQSGGLQDNAGDKIVVIRKSPAGISSTLEISYRDLMVEGKWYENIPLYPGDTINIPVERPFVVSVIGEVNKPGEHKFSRDGKVSILRVIAAAGGFTDYANKKKVLVKRENRGEPQEITINVRDIERNRATNFEMQHNDVIIVQ